MVHGEILAEDFVIIRRQHGAPSCTLNLSLIVLLLDLVFRLRLIKTTCELVLHNFILLLSKYVCLSLCWFYLPHKLARALTFI